MRFSVEYPIGSPGFDRQLLEPAVMSSFVADLERMGIDSVAFTEHPAPSKKWLEGGGHEALDPLTALAYCAATTTTIKLFTYLLVLPYRNPLLAAKQIATTDVLSGGRTIIGVGGGYLRSEFAALGVEFDDRNELTDEALRVLTSLWKTDSYSADDVGFRAVDLVSVPKPVQLPHPPIWIGGNSKIARDRVAKYGQGWAPLITTPLMSSTTRTAAIESVAELATAITDLRERVEKEGRDPAEIDVQVQWNEASHILGDPAEALKRLESLADAGVTWLCLNPPNGDVRRCLELLAAYCDEVVSQARDL